MTIDDSEVEDLLAALRGQLRDATSGLYAEPKWARATEVEIFIIEEWRQRRRQQPDASQDDGPVWTAEEMSQTRRDKR